MEKRTALFQNNDHKARHKYLRGELSEGRITELSVFPKMKVGPARIPYTPVFSYRTKNGEMIYEDFKGNTEGRILRIVKKMWKLWGEGRLQVIRRKGEEFKVTQYVQPIDDDGEIDGNR